MRARLALIVLAALIFASCRSVLSVKYEYDEEVYLALDGSATVYVNASVPALVALRGVDLDVDPHARLDRVRVAALYGSPVTNVVSTTSSRRDNRRYVHLRIEVTDIAQLSQAAPFAWSSYSIERREPLMFFKQVVGASSGRDVGDVGWRGGEMVAFRLHLPSRVSFHNAQGRTIERGNIIRWEQSLADRLKGEPLAIEVHMETASILARTLTLFGIMIALALSTMALAIWWVMRAKGYPGL
ncbi:MAG: hypothetical protein H0T71_05850 [Acidobacteria bacterium]|nr:hypothetical protein [Acidobacteriota bacterium]